MSEENKLEINQRTSFDTKAQWAYVKDSARLRELSLFVEWVREFYGEGIVPRGQVPDHLARYFADEDVIKTWRRAWSGADVLQIEIDLPDTVGGRIRPPQVTFSFIKEGVEKPIFRPIVTCQLYDFEHQIIQKRRENSWRRW